jgi:hypothetical protein
MRVSEPVVVVRIRLWSVRMLATSSRGCPFIVRVVAREVAATLAMREGGVESRSSSE